MANKKDSKNLISREQLNALIALLLVLIGQKGEKELLKKRRANKELVQYLGNQLGLSNKDLAAILNTTESGISNLKTKKEKQK
jgi:hypothetical protein